MRAVEASLACVVALSAGCAFERRAADKQDAAEKPAAVQRAAPDPAPSAVLQRSLEPTRVALVDTTVEGDPGDIATTLCRIRVTTGARTEIIPGVRTMTMPGVSADGKVYLFSYDEGGLLRSAHQYDPNTRRLADIQLPPDLELSGTKLATSPDARHIAHITYSEPSNYGLVRSWPDGRVVAQTPAEPVFESEIDLNTARWLDANRAEFVYRSGRGTKPGSTRSPDLWIRATVTLDPRALQVDSLSSPPEWIH